MLAGVHEEPSFQEAAAAFLARWWPALSLVGCLIGSPVAYLAFVGFSPATALLTSSILGLGAFIFAVVLAWPLGHRITWQRRMEVFGYRAAAGLGIYLAVGWVLLFLINVYSTKTVPLEWPEGYLRRVPFWPFYSMAVGGCEGWWAAPAGAC